MMKKIVELTITGKLGKVLGTILMMLLGVFLLYLAIQPPKFFAFLHGNLERIGFGIIGAFLILAGIKNVFRKK